MSHINRVAACGSTCRASLRLWDRLDATGYPAGSRGWHRRAAPPEPRTHCGMEAGRHLHGQPWQDLGGISLLLLRKPHQLGKDMFLRWNKCQIILTLQNVMLKSWSDQSQRSKQSQQEIIIQNLKICHHTKSENLFSGRDKMFWFRMIQLC